MFYKFKKGKSYEVGGDGDGWTIDSPFYWYRHTDSWKVSQASNEGHPGTNDRRIYFRVALKGGTTYTIGALGKDFDSGIWLFDINGTQVAYDDHSFGSINGEEFQDVTSYTPSADGIYFIAAGYYDGYSDMGKFDVGCYPAPETEEIPESTTVYETSSGFNAMGKPISYRSASGCGINYATFPKDGLVLQYDFKSLQAESGQEFTVASGTENFINVDNMPCGYFDGNTYLKTDDNRDYLAINESLALSFSGWFKLVSDTPGEGIFISRHDFFYWFAFGDVNRPLIGRIGYGGDVQKFISPNWTKPSDWKHVCIVFDSVRTGGKPKVYIDGELFNESIYYYDHLREPLPLCIGGYDYGNKFKGYLAKFRLYDRALTEKEIQLLYKEYKVV